MSTLTVAPTRMELTRLKGKLDAARRGHKLLKDKRDEMMRQFLDLIRQACALRERVERGISRANQDFAFAAAVMGERRVHTALLVPRQSAVVDVSSRSVMRVEVPVFHARTRTADPSDAFSYGWMETAADLDDAVTALSAVFPDRLRLAEVEKACMRLSAEIEKTRRRVNALEHVMIPAYTESIRQIRMKLDENERSTQIRLLKVKDRILAENRKAAH